MPSSNSFVEAPFEHRGSRTLEYLEVMRSLWCDEVSSFEGRFYSLPECRQYPKPVQSPHPPIYFGGESDAALKRVARAGQGWYGFGLAPDATAARVKQLEQLLADQGRKRGDVDVVISPYLLPTSRDDVARYAEAGVDQLVILAAARDTASVAATLDGVVSAAFDHGTRRMLQVSRRGARTGQSARGPKRQGATIA